MNKQKIIYSWFEVKQAIIQLASRVYNLIEEKGAENCILINVLSGGSYLTHKIIDKLAQDMLSELVTVDIKVSSYKGYTQTQMQNDYLPVIDCTGKTVIIIDDFCDSGNTTNHLQSLFKKMYHAKDIQFVTLLARGSRKLDEDVKLWYGIEDDTKNFYVGCGLDDNGKSRFTDYIYIKQ